MSASEFPSQENLDWKRVRDEALSSARKAAEEEGYILYTNPKTLEEVRDLNVESETFGLYTDPDFVQDVHDTIKDKLEDPGSTYGINYVRDSKLFDDQATEMLVDNVYFGSDEVIPLEDLDEMAAEINMAQLKTNKEKEELEATGNTSISDFDRWRRQKIHESRKDQ